MIGGIACWLPLATTRTDWKLHKLWHVNTRDCELDFRDRLYILTGFTFCWHSTYVMVFALQLCISEMWAQLLLYARLYTILHKSAAWCNHSFAQIDKGRFYCWNCMVGLLRGCQQARRSDLFVAGCFLLLRRLVTRQLQPYSLTMKAKIVILRACNESAANCTLYVRLKTEPPASWAQKWHLAQRLTDRFRLSTLSDRSRLLTIILTWLSKARSRCLSIVFPEQHW